MIENVGQLNSAMVLFGCGWVTLVGDRNTPNGCQLANGATPGLWE